MGNLTPHDITLMFLALGILLALARLLGEISQRFGQPSVVGELLAGIVLGPTVLGRLAPGVTAALFTDNGPVGVVLDGLTTMAIALFLLGAGMEVELSTMWRQGRAALSVALAGFAIPFLFALAVAWVAPYGLGCELDADPQVFALFFATAMAISALPVIAKTLMELNLYRSELGMIVIAAAVFNDLVGWLIFAVTLGLLGLPAGSTNIWGTIWMTLAFAAAMLTAGRALAHRLLPWLQAHSSWPGGILGFAMSMALLAAALTEWIGVHAVFGSFLVGVAIGDSPHLRKKTRETILDFVSFFFAPLFFASIGLRVDFIEKFYPAIVATVLVVACLGKVLGCGITARLAGRDWPNAWAIGFAMNARGAMEIILGLLAFENGLIRQRMLVALVVMAIVTSMMSGPAIQRLLRLRKNARFSDFLAPRAFRHRLAARDRLSALGELAALLAPEARRAPGEIVRAVDECQPARGDGIGPPLYLACGPLDGLSKPLVAVGVSPEGLAQDPCERGPVRLVLLVLVPPPPVGDADPLLADIARTFADLDAVRGALAARSVTEFLAVVRTGRRPLLRRIETLIAGEAADGAVSRS